MSRSVSPIVGGQAAISWAAGRTGVSLTLAGTAGYVNVGTPAGGIPNRYTVWALATPASGLAADVALANYRSTLAPDAGPFSLGVLGGTGAGVLRNAWIDGTSTPCSTSGTTDVRGRRGTYACSYDGATNRVFVDGRQEGSTANNKGPKTGGEVLYVGADPFSGPAGFFLGTIELLAIWNIARSAVDLQKLHESPLRLLRRTSIFGSLPALPR